MRSRTSIEVIGWYGTVAILSAYGLISFHLIDPGLIFQLLSFTGAIGIAIEAFNKDAKPAGWLNVIYAGIGIIALVKIIF